MYLVIFPWVGAGLRDCLLLAIIVCKTRPYILNVKNVHCNFSLGWAGLRDCLLLAIIVGGTRPYSLID